MMKLETPNNWIETILDEISFKITDGSHNPPSKQSFGFPMLSAQNILNNKIVFEGYRLISEKDFKEECKRANVEENDVLLTIVGTIGRASVVLPNTPKFTLQRSVALIKPAIINSYWLTYYLQSKICQQFFSSAEKGTAQKGVYLGTLKTIPIFLPPLPEQHRIVAKIEELFSELDKGIETLKTAKHQLKVYRQAVLKYAFEGRLTNPDVKEGELPEGWVVKSLAQITLEKSGLRRGPFGSAIKKEFFVPTGYKVYEQSNAIYDDHKRGNYYINKSKFDELKNFEVKEGDFIVSCSGTLGKITQIPIDAKPGVINQALLRIRLVDGMLLPKYFLFYFRSEMFQRLIFDQSQGTAMNNLIGIKDFKEITITFPGKIDEQILLVSEIESRLSVCDKIEESIEQGLQQAEALRHSILKKAFEGKLVPQDPNDEPASVLLERIKADRADKVPEKKTKIKKTS